MAARLVNVDRDTLLLLPPNMREWVPEGHLVHFILDAVGELDLLGARQAKGPIGVDAGLPGL